MPSGAGVRCGEAGFRRRGAAVVEAAVAMPVLLLVTLGVIQFGWALSVRNSLVTAAREGCRLAVIPNTTDQEILDRIDGILSAANITGYQVTLDRGVTDPDTEVVTITLPYEQWSLLGPLFDWTEMDMVTSCSMRREQ